MMVVGLTPISVGLRIFVNLNPGLAHESGAAIHDNVSQPYSIAETMQLKFELGTEYFCVNVSV